MTRGGLERSQRQAHNLHHAGSSPARATIETDGPDAGAGTQRSETHKRGGDNQVTSWGAARDRADMGEAGNRCWR